MGRPKGCKQKSHCFSVYLEIFKLKNSATYTARPLVFGSTQWLMLPTPSNVFTFSFFDCVGVVSIPVALLRRLLFFIVSNFPCNYGRACKQYKSNPRIAHNIEIVHSILQEMLQLKNASALQYPPTTIIIICFLSLQL